MLKQYHSNVDAWLCAWKWHLRAGRGTKVTTKPQQRHTLHAILLLPLSHRALPCLPRRLRHWRMHPHVSCWHHDGHNSISRVCGGGYSLSTRFLTRNTEGSPERARTVFHSLLDNYPSRIDLLGVWLDMEERACAWECARALYVRATTMRLSSKKMR